MEDYQKEAYEWTMRKLQEQNPYPSDENSLEYRQRINQDKMVALEIARALPNN